MPDVITFTCGCGKSYRVAANYAGREFSCKQCGARLTVPATSQSAPGPNDSRVELGSGSEVMRRTTPSGRQVMVDPTRVFAKQRETSARMAAVGGGQQGGAPKSRTGLFIAIGVVVLIAAGVGIAAAMGAFGGGEETTPKQQARAGNQPSTPEDKQEDLRKSILKQVDVPGKHAADFKALLKQADDAKLDDIDITLIAKRLVTAISDEQGEGFSDAELMLLAARMEKLNARPDAETLYDVIIRRDRNLKDKPPEFKQAHERLGHAKVDVGGAITRATELRDTGVVDGMDKLATELQEMEKRADNGWVTLTDKHRFDEIGGLLEKGQAKYDQIAKDDPFQIKVAKARKQFALGKFSRQGSWVTVGKEPFVLFCQQQGKETRDDTLQRVGAAVKAAAQFGKWFPDALITPLGLKRMLPADLSQAERDEAPLEILLFRDAPHWQPYLDDHTSGGVAAGKVASFVAPGDGVGSMAYEKAGDAATVSKFVRLLLSDVVYNWHPHAPRTTEEDKTFRHFHATVLENYFLIGMGHWTTSDPSYTNPDFTFMPDDPKIAGMLAAFAKPFAKDANGIPRQFGGQVVTVKDFVQAKDVATLRSLAYTRLKGFDGWTDADLMAVNNPNSMDWLLVRYAYGLYQFLYYWGPDGKPKYRDAFFKFVKMDLADEVDEANPLPAFTKAFGLDDAGWKQLEKDFATYQSAP